MTRRRLVRIVRTLPLVVEAAVGLVVASIRIGRTSQGRLVALLGEPRPAEPVPEPATPITDEQRSTVRRALRIGRIVTRVAGLLPWHPTCLRQSMAARTLLARRGIDATLHLGVADVATMDAHAWVTVEGRTVVGRQARRFTPVASFAPPDTR